MRLGGGKAASGARFAVRAVSALLGATALGSLLALATQMLAARWLGAGPYGQLAALLVVANLMTPIASAGANWFLIQAFGEEGAGAARWMRPLARIVGTAALVSVSAICAYALLGTSLGVAEKVAAAAAGAAVLAGQAAIELGTARLQIERRFGALAAWQSGAQALRFALLLAVGLAFRGEPGFVPVLAAYGAAGLALAAGGVALLLPLWRSLPRAGPAPAAGETLRRAAPFSLMTIFYVLYFQAGVVLLEWQRGGEAAAAFNAALLLVAAASMLPQVVYMKYLAPIISHWAVHDRARFSAVFHVGALAMAAAGAAGAAVLALGGPWVMPLLFGPGLSGAVPVLAVLALGLPVRFLQAAYSAAFVSPGEVAMKVRYLGLAAACGGAANLLLVPGFGAVGAAWAAVASEIVLLALHMRGARLAVEGISTRDLLRPTTSLASLRLLMREKSGAG